jgi:hypothetical protein
LFLILLAATAGASSLSQGFQSIPDCDRPWAYYWWLNGNVDEKTIRRDLEAMKQQGFGGLLLFDARGYHDDRNHVPAPPAKMEFFSPEWRRMLSYTLRTADRLGLEVSVNLSSCAGALKGPWPVGDDAPKRLLWCAKTVPAPGQFNCAFTNPAERSWNAATFAVRHETHPGIALDTWKEVASQLVALSPATEVVDISDKVDSQGRLAWEAPAGRWTVIRFVYAAMAGHEYDVDVLDARAVGGHFDRMGKRILEDAGPLAGKTLTHFYSVSWEGATPTWTKDFETEFVRYRGYVPRPWLPVLAGIAVRNRESSGRFLSDYYRTLSDCFRENFYGKLHQLCRQVGLKWHAESGGPWNRKLASFEKADQLAFLARTDMPQGEFWFTGSPIKRRQDMNRPAAMTAHIYGKPLAASEAFTHMVQHWSAYPAVLKPFADSAFCDGINHFVWHTFTASPAVLGRPGSEYFAGTHINPNVTWSSMASPFIDYLARCQFMLRQGTFVSDVCVYTGDSPYQHWGRGTKWSEKATLELPRGYTYDLITTEVLLQNTAVAGKDLRLSSGMQYRVLVVDLDDEAVPAAVLVKLAELRKAGASLVFGRRKPAQALGLKGFPDSDAEVKRLADELWQQSPPLSEVLRSLDLRPDFQGPCEYVHRRTAQEDVYFVSGEGQLDCTFRVTGRQPEIWDAVSGKMHDSTSWQYLADGRTAVRLHLPKNGSAFVVFSKPGMANQSPPVTPTAERVALSGPWNVRFEPGRGAPKTATFDTLTPWNEHPDERIRFFSGQATYREHFELSRSEANRNVKLSLGEVGCIAKVRLNGRDLGICWTDPWTVDLSAAVKPGANHLEVVVANTWVNRLIGDAALPSKKRITRTNVALEKGKRTLRPHQGFASNDPLMTSGLLGPVELEFTDRN